VSAMPPHDVRYLDLGDYLYLAAAALQVAPESMVHVVDLGLAESALHAPAATFGGVEFYPDLVTKAECWWSTLPRTTLCPTATSAPPTWP
jgi:hypothetical protein